MTNRNRNFPHTHPYKVASNSLTTNGKLYELNLDQHEFEIIEQKVEKVDMVSIAPNPGMDELRIELGQEWEHQTDVRIIDMMGRTHGFYQTDSRQFTVSDLVLPSGTYPILITGPNFSESVKWVKID